MRGEYNYDNSIFDELQGSPPLARGIQRYCITLRLGGGITPACAGNTKFATESQPLRRDHPRLRGEYSSFQVQAKSLPGSPPLARGILYWWGVLSGEPGITPACAGNTITVNNSWQFYQDHPRLRGEYQAQFFPLVAESGSPPLARGIPFKTTQDIYMYKDHPRLRGEYLKDSSKYWVQKGSPPLARGIQSYSYNFNR